MRTHYIRNYHPRRVGLLDEIRGVDIIAMVFYHAAYDLAFIFNVDVFMLRWPIIRFAQPFIACTFILLSGIACRYSRNNLKRGLIAFACGLALTAVTYFMMPQQIIYFGVLHLLGVAMMLFTPLEMLLDMIPPFPGALIATALFVVTYNLPDGYLGFTQIKALYLPKFLYGYPWLMPLGFGGAGSDYFPLLPWIFLFCAGAYLGIFFANNAFPDWVYDTHSKILSAIGRRTLIIYMLHQPVIYGVLPLWFTLFSK